MRTKLSKMLTTNGPFPSLEACFLRMFTCFYGDSWVQWLLPRVITYVLSQTEKTPGAGFRLNDFSTAGRKVWNLTQGQLLRSKSISLKAFSSMRVDWFFWLLWLLILIIIFLLFHDPTCQCSVFSVLIWCFPPDCIIYRLFRSLIPALPGTIKQDPPSMSFLG